MFQTGTATDEKDLLEKLHTFLTATGSAFGLTYSGVGNATLTGYKGGTASVAETFTITCYDQNTFSVVGSVSGALADAVSGTPYTGTKVQFLITEGSPLCEPGDVFTLSTAPKWTSLFRARGCEITSNVLTTGQYAVENLIDGKKLNNDSQQWSISGTPSPSWDVEFTMREAETIVEYAILAESSYHPTGWTFDYWNGSAWVTLDTQSGLSSGWTANVFRVFTVASPVSATKYRVRITAVQTSVASDTHAIELRRQPGGPSVAVSQYIWKAPGNDGTSEIYVGAHGFRRNDTDYYDIELVAMDAFNAALSIFEQTNRHSSVYVPCWNATMTYWFVADGRRAIIVVKGGSTQYEVGYLGFYDPYGTPAQLPYPICLGGSVTTGYERASGSQYWNDANLRWSATSQRHRAFTHTAPNIGYGGTVYDFQMRVRFPSGFWYGLYGGFNDAAMTGGTYHYIWPYHADFALLDKNLDGGYTLFPVILAAYGGALGQLSGVLALSGQDLTAETLIRVGAVDHLALPNINRTDRNDFLAVRLD